MQNLLSIIKITHVSSNNNIRKTVYNNELYDIFITDKLLLYK
jgi:hypothetical protein